jgi:hypothetical protein
MPGWGEAHEPSPETERAALVKDCADAIRAALAVYDEMIPKLGEARVKLARRLLELEGQEILDTEPGSPIVDHARLMLPADLADNVRRHYEETEPIPGASVIIGA